MDLKKKIASALSAAIVLMTSVPALGVSGAAVINGGFIKGDINLDKQVHLRISLPYLSILPENQL